MVRDMVHEMTPLDEKDSFNPERPVRLGTFSEFSPEEKADYVAMDPDYGEIVCRCEQITKREILDAIENPLGSRSIAGIKYRARAMMGRCQGGFCLPRIVEILEKEFGYNPEDFFLNRPDSKLFSGRVR
jgi:glycerol-3-phosphate dehydrogenase